MKSEHIKQVLVNDRHDMTDEDFTETLGFYAQAVLFESKTRYFNLTQRYSLHKYMVDGRVDVDKLAEVAKEITEEEAFKTPFWGSGNHSVEPNGTWRLLASNYDSSG